MNKELEEKLEKELEEALKVVKEPIIVNSIEYKYFDKENYNKLVNVIYYCNYLNANVKPYVEAQDKEIERLNNIIKLKTDFIHDLLEIIYYSDDTPLHSKAHLIGEEYEDKLKELKEGKENE